MDYNEGSIAAGLPHRQALLAGASTLLVAYTDNSLVGVAFLGVFFCWGLVYIRSHTRSTASKLGQSIWGALAAGAAALLICQTILQIVYAAGNAGWATDAHTKRVLQLFGLTKADGAKRIILVIAAPAVALAAALMEIRGSQTPQHGPPPPQEALLGPSTLERTRSTFSVAPTIVRAASYSNAGILAAVSLGLAAVVWPSLLCLAYLLLLAGAVLAWSASAPSPAGSRSMRILQVYAGIHILVLYLWQIDLIRRSMWHAASAWLGIYHLQHSHPADILAAQVLHMVALHVLFASLAVLAAARESHRPHLPSRQAGHHSTGPLEAFSALWHFNERHAARDSSVHDPLLGHGDPYGLEADPISASHAPTPAASIAGRGVTSISRLLSLVLPFTAGALLHALEGLCRQPHLPALALVGFALLQPSAVSFVGMMIGTAALLIPSKTRRHPLMASSHWICLALLLWHVTCYIATAVATAHVAIPSLAQSLGLLTFKQGSSAVAYLLAQLAVAMMLAALSRADLYMNDPEHAPSYDPTLPTAVGPLEPLPTLHDSIANYWHHGRRHSLSHDHSKHQADTGGPNRSSGEADSTAETRAAQGGEGGLTPIRTRVGQAAPPSQCPASLDDISQAGQGTPQPSPGLISPRSSPWPALQLALGRALYYLGFLALPAILFWVGLSSQNLLHAAYLALLVIWFLAHSLSLEPHVKAGALGNDQHWVLRIFASGHLVVMYLAVLTWLPGLPSLLHPSVAQGVLEALGVWHPSIVKGMLPVLLVLLLATVHANLGSWLEAQQQQHHVPILATPTAHPASVLFFGKAAVSFGALTVVLVTYILVLWGCEVGLLGLGYLVLLIGVFTYPPIRGRWNQTQEGGVELDENHQSSSSGEATAGSMKGSSPLRWLPLALLAIYAALDCLLQYTLAATDATSVLHIPSGVVNFIRDVVRISPDVRGGRLGVRLLRSVLTLGALHLFRFGFAVGTAQAHEERCAGAAGLSALEGLAALLKRLFILHSSKLMALAVFWAAMQQPGAIGWLLTLGLVVLSPLLGRSATAPKHQQRLMLLAMVILDAITGIWMLLQYAYEVDWLQQFLGSPDSMLSKAVLWAGIQAVPSRAAPMEAVLRSKCILLLAVTLKRRAVRWLNELPREVREAAGPGCACCLFWPPAEAARRRSIATSEGLWQRLKGLPLVHYVDLAAKESRAKFSKNVSRVLKAVDWPEGRKPNRPHSHHHHHQDASATPHQSQDGLEQAMPHRQNQKKRSRARAERWWAQLRLFQLAAIDQTERLWQNWGLEMTMFSLLVAAFLATNILSLVYMGVIAVGMAAQPGPRRRAWRFFFVPVLGLLLLLQYTVLIGLPPPFKWYPFSAAAGRAAHKPDHHQTYLAWLGLSYVDVPALWALFVAFGASIIQVHYDIWRHPTDVQRRQSVSHNTSLAYRLLPQSLQDAYADGNARLTDLTNGQAGEEGNTGLAASQTIWMPMEHGAQPHWRWLDWARFYFYRHYSDAVLVAVIALCTLENDVIHAGYLALALYFFRQRESLRTPALFRWLPLYNFGVMLLSLAYQAPLQNLWHGTPHRQGCNLAHILGLYKMTGRSGLAFSLSATGSIADVVLWAIARLQMRMYASATFQRAMQVVAQEQAAAAAAAAVKREAHKQRQVTKVLEASKLRSERATRVSKLKAGVSRSGGSFGVNSALLELDKEADDRESEQKLLGGSSASSSDPDLASLDVEEEAGGGISDTQQDGAVATDNPSEVQAQAQGTSENARGKGKPRGKQHPTWVTWLFNWVQRVDQESYTCYVLFVLIFILDFSLLTMLFPVSLAAYALATQRPSRLYWQACLVYLELILIAQYIFQIPTHLHCRAVSDTTQAYAHILGLHSHVLRAIPIFVVYLATLMHVYALARQQEPASGQATRGALLDSSSSTNSPSNDLELGIAPRGRGTSHRASQSSPKQGWWGRAQQGVFQGWQSFKGFLLSVCSSRERPLHFIKLQLPLLSGNADLSEEDGKQLESAVQSVLDDYRAKDVAAAKARMAAGATTHVHEQLDQIDFPLTEPTPDDSPPPDVDLARIGPLRVVLEEVVDEGGEAGLLAAVLQVIPDRILQPPESGLPTPIRSLRPAQDAASVLQRYKQEHPTSQSGMQDAHPERQALTDDGKQQQGESSHSTIDQPETVPAAGLFAGSPHSDPSETFADAVSGSPLGSRSSTASAATNATLQTAPSVQVDSSPRRNSDDSSQQQDEAEGRRSMQRRSRGAGLAGVLGSPSPPRQSHFARFVNSAAAVTGLSGSDAAPAEHAQAAPASNDQAESASQQESDIADDAGQKNHTETSQTTRGDDPQKMQQSGGDEAGPSNEISVSQGLQLGAVESHWRTETDYYAATVALDFLSFAFVALFYQSVMSSAQSLSDITDERVVPVDYLGVLILLFLFMVLDRLFYTLGLHLGKALLLWAQMALFYYYTFSLFWSPFSSSSARNQLRLLMLMKTASFALSALQLRSGYPPRASFRGAGGRHAFIFMRYVNTWGYLGLQVFCGLPFIYELRAVLDWSCTPTTLKLFDWLKLEDISTSLYFVTCDRYGREGRQLGDRQPRYMKFCQGTLLFLGLLVLLWVPLIVFSSGNPTYRVPGVAGFYLNASIGSMANGDMGDFQARMTFPLFVGGERQLQRQWVGNGTLPAGMGDQYTDDQLELLCVAEDSDRLWRLTPPAQKALAALLDDSSAAMSFSWSVLRNAPPLSPHGSPMCEATQTFQLAPRTRTELVDILEGTRTSAALMVANATDPEGDLPGKGGSRGLYSLFWQLRGDMCAVRTDFKYQSPGWGRGSGQEEQWSNQNVGCDISLADSSRNDVWWQLQCQVLDDNDQPVDNSQRGWATCNQGSFYGPRLVAVLERVQTGFLGQTLSSFGITGLYITFVFGIGRFLRLAATNIRMRIMYEDLPTTKRLIALCQDIYIARAQGELALEEELYWALINIYRSPAVMFELTKKKEV